MGTIFTNTAGLQDYTQTYITDLINEWGKLCRLVYPPTYETCPNCQSSIPGNKSANRYLHGGPIPFPLGQVCPMCDGDCKRAKQVSEEIMALVTWNPSEYVVGPDGQVRFPADYIVRLKTFIYHLPKIKMADHIIVDVSLEPYVSYRFRLKGEPIDRHKIAKGKFCKVYLERI